MGLARRRKVVFATDAIVGVEGRGSGSVVCGTHVCDVFGPVWMEKTRLDADSVQLVLRSGDVDVLGKVWVRRGVQRLVI
jgi:hypothetical protein